MISYIVICVCLIGGGLLAYEIYINLRVKFKKSQDMSLFLAMSGFSLELFVGMEGATGQMGRLLGEEAISFASTLIKIHIILIIYLMVKNINRVRKAKKEEAERKLKEKEKRESRNRNYNRIREICMGDNKKFDELHNELSSKTNQIGLLMSKASSYQVVLKPITHNRNPYLRGGAASAIGGPALGIAAAIDAIEKNQRDRQAKNDYYERLNNTRRAIDYCKNDMNSLYYDLKKIDKSEIELIKNNVPGHDDYFDKVLKYFSYHYELIETKSIRELTQNERNKNPDEIFSSVLMYMDDCADRYAYHNGLKVVANNLKLK